MREQQRVIPALGRERLDRLARRLPGQAQLRDVPLPELKTVRASLCDEQLQQFKTCHSRTGEVR